MMALEDLLRPCPSVTNASLRSGRYGEPTMNRLALDVEGPL